jgi:MFS family permease
MVELYDELHSGVFSVGSAAIQASFDISHRGLLATLLLAPFARGMVVEPYLFLLADRWPRRWFISGGLAAIGLAALGCALAPSIGWLAVAVALSGTATACGVELAQATLVDAQPEQRERAMARWVLFGTIGDLCAPLLIGALAIAGLGWRTGFVVMAVSFFGLAALVARAEFPAPAAAAPADDGAGELTVRQSLRLALGNRRLLAWLLASWLCDLLDELLVILAAVHLRDHGAGPVERSAIIAGEVVGGLVGLWLFERALAARSPRAILIASAAACATVYAAWLAAPALWLSAPLFALLGVTIAPLYPLTMAQCYAALPGRSGAVHAAGRIVTPLQLGVPVGIAALADGAGTAAALAVILVGPLGILAFAIALTPRRVLPSVARPSDGATSRDA